MRSKIAVLIAVLSVFALVACDMPWETQTGPEQNVNVNVNVGQSPTVAPTPSGTPVPGSQVKPASVRVGIFGQACTNGASVPNNALNEIRLGCVANFTATPKHANGSDLTETEHGPNIQWSVSGAACNDLDSGGQNTVNPFNRDIKGAAVGSCQVCATVLGVQGCARQPDGSNGVVVK